MNLTQSTGLLTTILAAVAQFLTSLSELWEKIDSFVYAQLGEFGQWAFWAFCALALLTLAAFAARLMFRTVQWVLVPSALLSIAGLTLAPGISPMHTFPVFIGLTTLVMLLRGR